MRFDPAADPWGTAMLAAAALWLLSLLVVIAAFVARTSRRTGGRIMLVSLLVFLAAAAGGTWTRIRRADAIAAQPPPPPPKTIVAKVPPVDPDVGPSRSDEPPGEPESAMGDGEAGGGNGTGVATGADQASGDAGTTADVGSTGMADEAATSTAGDEAGGDEADAGATADVPPSTKVPERVVPPNVPQAPALPTEPEARAAAIRDILQDAERAAGGGRRCGNLERVAEAWARLRTVPVDRQAKAVAADLETCRRKLLYSISRRHRSERVDARDAYYAKLREHMRKDHGLVVQAAISGQSHERLRIGNPELDAARADALMDAGLRAELVELEFARVVLTNGKKARTYEFEVPPESELGLPDLRAVGLGEPLELGEP